MTRDEILSADLTTLRLLVAEHVMGHPGPYPLEGVPCPDGLPGCEVLHRDHFDTNGGRIPDYPEDVAAAWPVLEKMRERYRTACVFVGADGGVGAQAWNPGGGGVHVPTTCRTPAEAICRAALLATLEGEE